MLVNHVTSSFCFEHLELTEREGGFIPGNVNPSSCSIWLFLVTKFIYLLSKGGPVSK